MASSDPEIKAGPIVDDNHRLCYTGLPLAVLTRPVLMTTTQTLEQGSTQKAGGPAERTGRNDWTLHVVRLTIESRGMHP